MKKLILLVALSLVSFAQNTYDFEPIIKDDRLYTFKDGNLDRYDNYINKSYFSKEVGGKIEHSAKEIELVFGNAMGITGRYNKKNKLIAKTFYVKDKKGVVKVISNVELVSYERVKNIALPSGYEYLGSLDSRKTRNSTTVERYKTPKGNYLFIVKYYNENYQKFTLISKDYLHTVTQDYINSYKNK